MLFRSANDTRDIEVIDPEEVSNKWEVEDTSGNVTVHEESDSEFPNENNPTSVAATVAEIQNKFGTYPPIVEKLITSHLPKTETTTTSPVVKKVTKKTSNPVETTTKAPINEDDLFDKAMRKKAEQDKLEFLRKKGIAKASKKMSRTASEGLALVKKENNQISIIEINSETDFVAKNED